MPLDKLNEIYDRIYEISDEFKSYKDAIHGFDRSPVGYKYIFAVDYIDADLRNGGISQLHHNSTWHLMLDAIEGANALNLNPLAQCLTEILYYYHRQGRSKMKKRIPADFFDALPERWEKDLDTLEDQYYDSFAQMETDQTGELWTRALQSHPDLFTSA